MIKNDNGFPVDTENILETLEQKGYPPHIVTIVDLLSSGALRSPCTRTDTGEYCLHRKQLINSIKQFVHDKQCKYHVTGLNEGVILFVKIEDIEEFVDDTLKEAKLRDVDGILLKKEHHYNVYMNAICEANNIDVRDVFKMENI